MRRSTTVTLTLLAGAGLGLVYCHNEPDTDGVLESEAACVARLGYDASSECADVFQSARENHAGTAPRFGSAEDCRAATGADYRTRIMTLFYRITVPYGGATGTISVVKQSSPVDGDAIPSPTRGSWTSC